MMFVVLEYFLVQWVSCRCSNNNNTIIINIIIIRLRLLLFFIIIVIIVKDYKLSNCT